MWCFQATLCRVRADVHSLMSRVSALAAAACPRMFRRSTRMSSVRWFVTAASARMHRSAPQVDPDPSSPDPCARMDRTIARSINGLRAAVAAPARMSRTSSSTCAGHATRFGWAPGPRPPASFNRAAPMRPQLSRMDRVTPVVQSGVAVAAPAGVPALRGWTQKGAGDARSMGMDRCLRRHEGRRTSAPGWRMTLARPRPAG